MSVTGLAESGRLLHHPSGHCEPQGQAPLKNLAIPLLQQVGPSLALISLLLFAYFFPRLPRRQRGEARLVVGGRRWSWRP